MKRKKLLEQKIVAVVIVLFGILGIVIDHDFTLMIIATPIAFKLFFARKIYIW